MNVEDTVFLSEEKGKQQAADQQAGERKVGEDGEKRSKKVLKELNSFDTESKPRRYWRHPNATVRTRDSGFNVANTDSNMDFKNWLNSQVFMLEICL